MGFRVTFQRDIMQCGAACLTMACEAFGKRLSLDYINGLCGTGKQGVTMLAISNVAGELGLENATVKLTPERLAEMPLPCILHWNHNHFVVLYKVSKSGKDYYIADPGKGKFKCGRDELERHWISDTNGLEQKGVAMFFNPTQKFHDMESQPEETVSFGIVVKFVRDNLRYFIQLLIGLVLACLMQLIMPFLTQSIVDSGIKNSSVQLIWLILLGEVLILVGSTVTEFVRRWVLLHLSMHINLTLLSSFFVKLLHLPMRFFESRKTGDIMQRMSDHGRIRTFLTGQLLGIIFTVVSFIVFGVTLLIYNHTIFFIFLILSIAYCCWVTVFLKRRKIIDYENFSASSRNQELTFRMVNSMQEIKLQDCKERRRQITGAHQ